MSNEEIVLNIQRGVNPSENMTDLYNSNYGLIVKAANHFKGLLDPEDAKQEAFLIMYSAIFHFDVNAGSKFATYLYRALINGLYRKIDNKSPDMVSLDTPLKSAEDMTLLDTISAPGDDIKATDEKVDKEFLHDEIMEQIEKLPENEKEAILDKFYRDEAAEAKALIKAKRKLMRDNKMIQIARREGYLRSSLPYRGSLSSFKNTRTSIVEDIVLKILGDDYPDL